jgi:hypothetical protein
MLEILLAPLCAQAPLANLLPRAGARGAKLRTPVKKVWNGKHPAAQSAAAVTKPYREARVSS